MLTQPKRLYSQVPQLDVTSPPTASLSRLVFDIPSLKLFQKIFGILCWTILTMTTGFVLGRNLGSPYAPEVPNSHIHLPTVSQVFHYNRTFAEIPSDISDKAWESLFPPLGGFFNTSEISSQRSTLSIFHQLHCLDGIRHSYWDLYLAFHSNTSRNENSMQHMSSPSHVRHCIDLLRQSLMCSADTTLEIKEEQVDGVHGFGVVHQCSDWGHLLREISRKQQPVPRLANQRP